MNTKDRNQPVYSRREFLSVSAKTAGLVSLAGYMPHFLARTASAAPLETDQPVLVIIQLSGGNDGLNTLAPFQDDAYYRARPTLGLPKNSLLTLTDSLGLNPALEPFKALYDEGRLAIVQNTGYPNPNRSHFKSMEIWHTADEKLHELRGWVGRYFDNQCGGEDPAVRDGEDRATIGLSLGRTMPQAFRNHANVGLSLQDPETFRWNTSGETIGLAKAQERIFQAINKPRDHRLGMGGGAPSSMTSSSRARDGGIRGTDAGSVDFLRHTAMNAVLAGDKIRGLLEKEPRGRAEYPDSRLGQQLRMVSSLIAGRLPTRVYYVSQGGYDTHARQAETHNQLLTDFSASTAAFLQDLKNQKNDQQVLCMAFSEFGRRVAENGSAGTDHGAAAPMFLLGSPVQGGIRGENPDLENLINGDLRHTTDFRQVYATVLEDWLQVAHRQVLGREFEKLDLVRA